jgi:hypothetical protein
VKTAQASEDGSDVVDPKRASRYDYRRQ